MNVQTTEPRVISLEGYEESGIVELGVFACVKLFFIELVAAVPCAYAHVAEIRRLGVER
jgi:hypothetical protein